jgi:hypothetical protein
MQDAGRSVARDHLPGPDHVNVGRSFVVEVTPDVFRLVTSIKRFPFKPRFLASTEGPRDSVYPGFSLFGARGWERQRTWPSAGHPAFRDRGSLSGFAGRSAFPYYRLAHRIGEGLLSETPASAPHPRQRCMFTGSGYFRRLIGTMGSCLKMYLN